jgi:exonuclease III
LNVYTPNSGEGLKRLEYRTSQWDKALAGYIKVRARARESESEREACCAAGARSAHARALERAGWGCCTQSRAGCGLLGGTHAVLQGLCTGAGGKPAKPVVVLGDLNCAHQPLDIYDPKRHTRSAGFTDVRAPWRRGAARRASMRRAAGSRVAAAPPWRDCQLTGAVVRALGCGRSQEERESFSCELLGGAGLVDAWRAQHPGVVSCACGETRARA